MEYAVILCGLTALGVIETFWPFLVLIIVLGLFLYWTTGAK